MADAKLIFKPSVATTVTEYDVTFSVNGAPAPVFKIGPGATGADGDFTVLLSQVTTVTLKAGDSVGASVVAVDGVRGLSSTPAVATTVTVPTPVSPPDAPVIVSLSVV